MNEQLIEKLEKLNLYIENTMLIERSFVENELNSIIAALTSVKSESAEKVLKQFAPFSTYDTKFYTYDQVIQAMHDFANKSEAMNDCQITFGNHFKTKFKIVDNRIEILDAINGWGDNVPKEEIKVEYLTTKEKTK